MPIGALLGWIFCALTVFLSVKISVWFAVLSVLFGIYAFVCTCLSVSYGRLLRRLG